MVSFQDSLFGRMSAEPSAVMAEKTSPPFSRSWLAERYMSPVGAGETQVLLLDPSDNALGAYLTANFSECPNAAAESSLSQILEANVPEKYFLSPKACAGILKRAEARGKRLPDALQSALTGVLQEKESRKL